MNGNGFSIKINDNIKTNIPKNGPVFSGRTS